MSQKSSDRRTDYGYFVTIPSRWNDNDMLGHVNNVVYYSYFEAIVVRFIMEEVGIDWAKDPIIPYAAESLCQFRKPLAFPQIIDGGFRVTKLGRASVTYDLALFRQGEDLAAAHGHWVHVFVDRENERPVEIPAAMRAIFEKYKN